MSSLHYGVTPKMKPLSLKRAAHVAVLDIGSSKAVCVIARLRPQQPKETLRHRTHTVEIIGYGHTQSRGIKAGSVSDLGLVEQTIRHVVDLAERSAGLQLESVILSIAAGRPGSEQISASIDVIGGAVTEGDISRVLGAGGRHSVRHGRALLHSIPLGFRVDHGPLIQDPRGMLAQNFGIDMHLATTDISVVRNLMLAVERCHLSIEATVSAPYAAGLSSLADDEADLGAAVIDIGAETTTVAIFSGGRFTHHDGFAIGGRHVTMDIARGLNTRITDAERIKTLYGSVLAGSSDERDMISIPSVGDENEPPQFASRANLVRIIKPRVEEILELVRDRLAASPFAAEPRGRMILTGGASQLTGLSELAAQIIGRPSRVARPLGVTGLPEEAKAPAFAVAAGLLVYPQVVRLEHFEPRRARQMMTGTGYFSRVGRWLKESF